MIALFYVFLSIIILFFVLAIIKSKFKLGNEFCAICYSSILTWLTLLVLYWYGIFNKPVIIAVLLGETVIGVFYTVESKVNEELKLFRLPFLLTIMFAAFLLLKVTESFIKIILLLTILWIFFFFLYNYRNNKNFSGFVRKIIDCCKNW